MGFEELGGAQGIAVGKDIDAADDVIRADDSTM
jgi:hypothetical protein